VSEKKRIRRDIEKYTRMGRYWELLRLLKDEGLTTEHAREEGEAWKAVIKQALRSEQAFQQFLNEVGSFERQPGGPDCRLLMLLKDFIEKMGSAEAILQLKGLSADAERIRLKVAALASRASDFSRLRVLLEKFVKEPEKITRRYFEDLAVMLPSPQLITAARRLGDLIPVARRFNHKAAVARGWAGIDFMSLERLDSGVARVSGGLPPALREVLLFPFIHNLALMCRRLALKASRRNATELVHSIPFLLPKLAGEKMGDIERELLIREGDWVEADYGQEGALEQKMSAMSLEEKVMLLGGLRAKAQDTPAEEPGFGDLVFEEEGDDDDDDDFSGNGSSQARNLARSLLTAHRSILGDISLRAPKLPSREKKDLVRVMEPVLLQDLDFIFDHVRYFEDVESFLERAMESGCTGVRMGLLALLISGSFCKTDLRGEAERHLDRLPPPTREDMQWLARRWNELFYPKARALRPLFLRCRGDATLLSPFAVQLCILVEQDILDSMIKPAFLSFPLFSFAEVESPRPEDPGILRRELDDLSEFKVLDVVRHFLRCYSKDRLDLEGNLCWLNAMRAIRPDEVWGVALEDLKKYETIHSHAQSMLRIRELSSIISGKVQAVLLFMKEHQEEVSKLPVVELEALLDGLINYPEILQDHSSVLVQINNRLHERFMGGEESVRTLLDRVKKTLIDLARTEKKSARPRKRRR
jgi:hypothetical protein